MSRPWIGISCKFALSKQDTVYKLDRRYADAVRAAGGIPVLLPLFTDEADARDIVSQLDGVILSGGPDLDPSLWGEAKHEKSEVLHPEKQSSDLAAIHASLGLDAPLLAICLGCQELNVALGGSLHQHVPDLNGGIDHGDGARHPVRVEAGSRIASLLGRADLEVNSHHHQALNRLGSGLVATAHAPDGIVESVELPGRRFVVGVQWHPERIADRPEQAALFSALVAEARR